MSQERRKRRHHLRVPVFPEEEKFIKAQAKATGMSVARYLREVGQGYRIKSVVDYLQVRELARISGDLGRLGGLLKLWLTDDERVRNFGEGTIRRLLDRILETQDEMKEVMKSVVMPRAGR
jgi:Mobilization protein NikA